MNIRFLAGLLLGFAIGFGCRAFGIPVPAPPVLIGALLVVAMSSGYLLADRYRLARGSTRPQQATAGAGHASGSGDRP